MFSPSRANTGGPATATRSRRRQRPLSNENVTQQPKAKRQRVPLTEQTFVNPEPQPAPEQNHQQQRSGHAHSDSIEVKADKAYSLDLAKGSDVENQQQPTARRDLNVRAKKTKHGDRAANKGDGSLVLVCFPLPSLIRACLLRVARLFCPPLDMLTVGCHFSRPAPMPTP